MGVPTKKGTKGKRDKRRLQIFLKAPSLISCLKCGAKILPHTICQYCGYYRGREEIDVLAKLEKKERKKREKEIKEKEKESPKRAPKPLSWQELSKK